MSELPIVPLIAIDQATLPKAYPVIASTEGDQGLICVLAKGDVWRLSRRARLGWSTGWAVRGNLGELRSLKGDPRTRLVSLFVLLGMLTLCAGWHILRRVRHIEEDDELSAWFAPERATALLHGFFTDRAQRCHWVR